MSALIAYVPWALFGIMVLFGLVFAIVALRQSGKASAAAGQAAQAQAALGAMEQRARAAEARIGEAEQRAQLAEQRIAHAEERAEKAREAGKAAEAAAAEAQRRAEQALSEARRADSALQQRRSAADEKVEKSRMRARSLHDWAKQQWETRREPDRQKAQGQQGSFQAQLDAYLEYRRTPITFRVETEIDRMAAPLIEHYKAADERVVVDGDLVRITFPVDASQGFRA